MSEDNKVLVPQNQKERQQMLEKIWGNTEQIRKMIAPNLNKTEFSQFVGMGRAHGANPLTKEIYPMKIRGQLQVVLARDFYRRKAQEQASYAGHNVYGVHKGEKVMVSGDEITDFEVNLASDKPLVGAVAIGHRSDIDKPFTVFVKLGEYNRNNSMWNSKTLTMIKKVAEGQLLRAMYQGIFEGTYMEGELPNDNEDGDFNEVETAEAVILEED